MNSSKGSSYSGGEKLKISEISLHLKGSHSTSL